MFSKITALLLAGFLLAGALAATAAEGAAVMEKSAENQKKVEQFIREAGHYFIATVEGDQPRVRPFGTILVFEGKLYIQTGKRKNVAKQIAKNGKVELCALKGDQWIRVSGTLVNDDRREAKAAMLDAYPSLKELYSPDDDNTQVLYFTDAVATIYSFTKEPVVLKW